MRNTRVSSAFAVVCTILLSAGVLFTFYLAWQSGLDSTIEDIVGLAVSLFLAPVFHELGHIAFAKLGKMRIMYSKFFCFKIYEKEGKNRFGFASPFRADETQAIPKTSLNMQKRASLYTLGGLIFSGVLLVVILATALICSLLGTTNFVFWGMIPYLAYLFLLNALPFEYASGKTDMLVYIGLKKGYAAEKNMLAAMTIQGGLFEGKSYGEIDEALYFDLPQLAEDEPLFAVMLDLKYRYYLDKENIEKAADCLNRLTVCVQEYLPETDGEKISAEFVYIHSLLQDFEGAEACGKCCRNFLQSDSATAKRVLAAYCNAFGKADAVGDLKTQAEELLNKEPVAGVAKFERKLLSRIATA